MNENKDIKSQVLQKIETGELNMKPRSYFVLKLACLIFVAIMTLLTSSLLVSFIIFSLIESGKLFLFGFGARGFLIFFELFPWTLLAVEIILIILLEWLLKKFKLGYRTSFTTLILIILCMSLAISLIIGSTSLHKVLLRRSEHDDIPIVGQYYRGIRRPPPGQEIFRGVVSDVGTSSFIIDQDRYPDDASSSQVYIVILPIPLPQSIIPSVGDMVFVAGHLTPNNVIQAYGFQKLPTPEPDMQ